MSGEELDLGNQQFDAVLGQDMNNTFVFANGSQVTQPGSPFPAYAEMRHLTCTPH